MQKGRPHLLIIQKWQLRVQSRQPGTGESQDHATAALASGSFQTSRDKIEIPALDSGLQKLKEGKRQALLPPWRS